MFLRNKKIVYVVIGVLVVLNIFAYLVVSELEDDLLEVVFFDVGQGDSAFIETPDGYQVLIDGGPDLTVLEKLGQEMPFYDKTIDLVILTHPHRDHLFGLLEVLKRYEVKNVLWTGVAGDNAEYQEWKSLIKDTNIIIAEAGQKIDLSDDIYILIHHPFESLDEQEVKYANDGSIVAELVFSDVSFLFMGDTPGKIEKNLDIDSDILKVAHHGSKTSTSAEFLERVSPQVAVISVGENKYGHPSFRVLQTLEEFAIHTLITKELKDIKIVSNGSNFNIK